ncbi:hypothetical protein OSTOST_17459, partial [Ostertagia ostertagi]
MNSAIVQQLRSLLTLSEEEASRQLQSLNASLGAQTEFQFVDPAMRQDIAKMIESSSDKPSLRAPLLELIRILARDKRQLDVLLTEAVRSFIIRASGHSDTNSEVLQDVIEADKCLVNTLFNSSVMRHTFEAEAIPFLLERISAFTNANYSGRYEWINEVPEDSRNSLWLFDLRIAFLTSAHSPSIQQFTNEITEIVCKLVKGKHSSPAMEQHAVNLLSTLKLNINMLCPK